MTALQINESDLTDLKGKVVIITGGSAGIGFGATTLFSRLGAHVFVADLAPPPQQLPNTTYIKTNVTSWLDLVNLFSTAYAAHARLDVLIANAGVGEIEDIFDETTDDKGQLKEPKHIILDVNLKGVINCAKLAVHHMKKCGGGSIVMTGSAASYIGEALPCYTSAKHGVLGFMRATNKKLIKDNITINMIAPYFTESNLIFPALRAVLEREKIQISSALSVAKAMAYCAVARTESGRWTGRTLYVAFDRFTEIEGPLLQLRTQWLGDDNSKAFSRDDNPFEGLSQVVEE